MASWRPDQAARVWPYHRTYISSVELGRRNPPLLTVIRFGEVVDLTASELLAEAGL